MKMDLGWHKNCLNNQKRYLLQQEAILARMIDETNRLRKAVEFKQKQITMAEAAGKDGFDGEKYLKKENPQTAG